MTIRDRLAKAIDGLISTPQAISDGDPKQDQNYGELASMWSNTWTGLGSTSSDRVTAHVPGAPIVLPKPELAYLTIGDPIARTVVSAIVDDGMRGGFQIVYKGESERDAEFVEEVEDACVQLDLEGKARRAAKSARSVGGGGLILITNGGMEATSQPLIDDRVRSVERLIVADARDLIIATWKIDKVETFRYVPMTLSAELQGITDLHSSHVAIFEGVDTPVRDRQELFEGWYASALQAVWESIREFRSSWQSAVAMLQDGSIPVLKLPGLGKVLARGGRSSLTNRLSQLSVLRAVNKVLALDAGDASGSPSEDLSFVERTFAGIGELVAEQKVLVAQSADMPITRLFGVSPAGMNATGEYDELNWLSKTAAWRRSNIQPPIERIVRLIAKSRGAIDWQGFGIEWPQLEVMSTKSRVEIENIQTMTDVARARDLGMPEQTILEHRYSGEYRFSPPVLSEMDHAMLEAHAKAAVVTEPEEPEPEEA